MATVTRRNGTPALSAKVLALLSTPLHLPDSPSMTVMRERLSRGACLMPRGDRATGTVEELSSVCPTEPRDTRPRTP